MKIPPELMLKLRAVLEEIFEANFLKGSTIKSESKNAPFGNPMKTILEPSEITGEERGGSRGGNRKGCQPKNDLSNKTAPNGDLTQGLCKIEFDRFWAIYPRRVAKGQAWKAYKAALKRGATNEQIKLGAERYQIACRQAGTEKQYIRHAATWLNGDGWLDEDGPPPGPSGQSNKGTVAAMRRLIDKHRRNLE